MSLKKTSFLSLFIFTVPIMACPPLCADAAFLKTTTKSIIEYYDEKDRKLAEKYEEWHEIIDDVFTLQKDTNVLLEKSLQVHSLNILTRGTINTKTKAQIKMLGEK